MAAVNLRRALVGVNRNLLLTFVDVLQTDALEPTFSLESFNFLTFYQGVKERDIPETCVLCHS